MSEPTNGGDVRDPEEIRRDIEQTRTELGDTVAALAEKADVKGRAKDRVHEIKDNVTGHAGEAKDKVRGATPESAAHAAQAVGRTGREHPLPLLIGAALIAGFVIGRLTTGD